MSLPIGSKFGSAPLRRLFAALCLLFVSCSLAAAESATKDTSWASSLKARFAQIDADFDGELGVYAKNLATGEVVSFRGEETWYFASGIKVPVAIQVMREIDRGNLNLDSKVQLQASDYVDGAGQTNWSPPGSQLSVRFLMEQMLQHSDNTATDILIRLVGLDAVNRVAHELVPVGFGEITTLKDVRRHAYAGLHPRAFELSGDDFFTLQKARGDAARAAALAAVLGVTVADFVLPSLGDAFEAYYRSGLNGGQLAAYGKLLEQLTAGAGLRADSAAYLMTLMGGVQTGKQRIKAGLAPAMRFAHKTGTQYARTCDFGIASAGEQVAPVIIAACTRGTRSRAHSEAALRSVGEAIRDSGLLQPRAMQVTAP